jgi:chromosome segregation ATPase
LLKFALAFNAELEDNSPSTEDSKSFDGLESEEVQDRLKDLVNHLIYFKNQYKLTDKAELVIRNEQFDMMLRKLEAEIRSHVTVEHQLKLHIENYEKEIQELEMTEKNDKKNLKKLEGKFIGKKNLKNTEAEKIRKEMEEKIIELTEISKKKEKNLHKIEFENIKLRNLIEEKDKECDVLKKEIIRLSKTNPKREQSGNETIRKKIEGGKVNNNSRDFSESRNQLGKSMDENLDSERRGSPGKKITRSNTMDIGKKLNAKNSISGNKILMDKFSAHKSKCL